MWATVAMELSQEHGDDTDMAITVTTNRECVVYVVYLVMYSIIQLSLHLVLLQYCLYMYGQ